ncbi:hypothetical protein Prubr_32280 [Polymorphospora rubra]|uniref:Uncharacterized protein n=1 Tax=Polymorphospora rubra TaxID=338584 RepID=A0A810MYJ7_9ACTN|nr:hypothetical protein Prubr_32280 [Polymorphospora rubra]
MRQKAIASAGAAAKAISGADDDTATMAIEMDAMVSGSTVGRCTINHPDTPIRPDRPAVMITSNLMHCP